MLNEIFLFILGEHGFNAYSNGGGGGPNHEGSFIPSWENVGDRIRIKWARTMGDVLLRRVNGERETSVLGQYAYARYSHYAGGVDRLNRPLPNWTDIDEKTRLRWVAAANRISEIAGAYIGQRCEQEIGSAKGMLCGVITFDNLYLIPDAVLGLANGPFRLLSLISTSTENLVQPGENHIGTTSIVRAIWSGMLRAGMLPDAALEALSVGVKTIVDEREALRQPRVRFGSDPSGKATKADPDPNAPFSFQEDSPEPNLDRFRTEEPEPIITPANLLELLLRVVLVHAVASNGTNASHTPELEAAWQNAIAGWSDKERAEAHAYIAALEFAAKGEPVNDSPTMPKCIEDLPTNDGLETDGGGT